MLSDIQASGFSLSIPKLVLASQKSVKFMSLCDSKIIEQTQ